MPAINVPTDARHTAACTQITAATVFALITAVWFGTNLPILVLAIAWPLTVVTGILGAVNLVRLGAAKRYWYAAAALLLVPILNVLVVFALVFKARAARLRGLPSVGLTG